MGTKLHLFGFILISLFILNLPIMGENITDRERIIVNTGHQGAVNDMEYDIASGFIYTSGNDGTLRIWDPSSKKLIHRMQLSNLPIVDITVDPTSSKIAAIESDEVDIYRMSVWNWKTGKKYFDKTLNGIPLFFKFSPGGNFITYGRTNWESLKFVQSETGRELPYLNKGFGIVSYGLTDKRENTIMTYSPSTGALSFWNIKTGKQTSELKTTPNLSNISPLPPVEQPKYAAASTEDHLVIINLWNGIMESSVYLPDITHITVNNEENEIGCISLMDGKPVFSKWEFDKNSSILSRRYTPIEDIPEDVTGIKYINDILYATGESGVILRYSLYTGSPVTFSENELIKINDLVFKDNHLVFSTSEKLTTLTSDFFSDNTPAKPTASFISEQYRDIPFQGEILLEKYLYESILLWSKNSNEEGIFYIFNPSTGYIGSSYHDFSSSLRSLTVSDETITVIDKQGTLRILDAYNYETLFTYRALGMQKAIHTESGDLLLGKSVTSPFESSLIKINPKTGETVPIENPAFLIFDMASHEESGYLYTLSLERRGTRVFTSINAHFGENFVKQEPLYSVEGENIDSQIVFDPQENKLYTTAGFRGILNITDNLILKLESNNRLPKKIYLHENGIYAVNTDGTLSMWDKKSGTHLFDLYVFQDHSWVVLTKNQYYYSSMRGLPRQMLNIFDGIIEYRGNENRFNFMKSYKSGF
jgi:WD40 repeat protein